MTLKLWCDTEMKQVLWFQDRGYTLRYRFSSNLRERKWIQYSTYKQSNLKICLRLDRTKWRIYMLYREGNKDIQTYGQLKVRNKDRYFPPFFNWSEFIKFCTGVKGKYFVFGLLFKIIFLTLQQFKIWSMCIKKSFYYLFFIRLVFRWREEDLFVYENT
jgi:hypothetical protein